MKLDVKGVSKQYKTKLALNDITISLTNGVYGLVGPNGAGKTTLINILVNILNPTTGEVLYDGKTITSNIEDYLGQLGYLPQYPKFYGTFTCIEFLRYICALKDIPKNLGKERIQDVLTVCNLMDDKDRKIKEFSGGMRQRLGIAQAIINQPNLLILDEPTAGLDPKERIRFRNIISNLSENRIILLATHILEDVESIANQMILIQDGKLLGIKHTKDVLHEIEGNVWELTIPAKELPFYEAKYRISSIFHEQNMCTLRVLSDHVVAHARNVSPKLEEVYLYYFDTGNCI